MKKSIRETPVQSGIRLVRQLVILGCSADNVDETNDELVTHCNTFVVSELREDSRFTEWFSQWDTATTSFVVDKIHKEEDTPIYNAFYAASDRFYRKVFQALAAST